MEPLDSDGDVMKRFTRREALQAGVAGLGVFAAVGAAPSTGKFSFHFDHVLGTSLDGWVTSETRSAEIAEQVVLDEIERLRTIFSLYDPTSELSRMNTTSANVVASPDLAAVMREYEEWHRRTDGACNPRVGVFVRLWKEAELRGEEPDAAELDVLARDIAGPAWRREGRRVTRFSGHPLDLNSVAKGYILQRAIDAVRANVPGVSGMLLNLGGDLYSWGESLIGIQDPHHPTENATPLTVVRVKDGAIATSGGYQRYFTIGERRYSHLIDPRTGYPADGLASATVLAPTSTLANALATTLCVLSSEEGLRLVASIPGVECLLVTPTGKQIRSTGFAQHEVAFTAMNGQDPVKPKEKGEPWPKDFQVNIAVELPKLTGSRYRRPYVAVWVENADGKPVRTITVWGNQPRWIGELSGWWKFAKDDKALVKAVSRATRAPGKYDVVWDGKDDAGNALPQGTYTIKVEVHREHGKHVTQTGKLLCGAETAQIKLEKNTETAETVVDYAKKKEEKKDEKK